MRQAGDGEFGGVQVVGVVFQHLDDGGSVKGDLLAYICPSMMGDGGQGSQSDMAGAVLFDEREDLGQKTLIKWSSAYSIAAKISDTLF